MQTEQTATELDKPRATPGRKNKYGQALLRIFSTARGDLAHAIEAEARKLSLSHGAYLLHCRTEMLTLQARSAELENELKTKLNTLESKVSALTEQLAS